MKIAIIGYGAMGKIIERLAKEAAHEVAVVVDQESAGDSPEELAGKLRGVDAAIDFSVADAVTRNVEACCVAGVPLVEGTTGWNGELEKIRSIVEESNCALVYGANFSIGVNLFYRMVRRASELMSRFREYEAFIEERHHSRKVDAPSGTALKLKQIIEENIDAGFSVSSTRAGNIPGTHTVGFDGPFDQISLEHTARSREGFASGALSAAEWAIGKSGFWEFPEVIDEIIGD
ncbi:MAG: dihydrodipicolinate reductase [Acidobacteria bacterium]|nr:MAG: dihydrodipicolinate reductase [Acidobacteriota bacterium]REK03154.1 MAG: dihydrodipicolinate reductase [Acidobacteriota bacterium]REK15393.1 MAG: dihydrodipicolinate reductase [Acidobacteriota bacterium]REK42112.1 MAG: dihydrodipicolinate reductase [Acidobacteriota bacterium]